VLWLGLVGCISNKRPYEDGTPTEIVVKERMIVDETARTALPQS